MKTLLVVCHPRPTSLTHQIAEAFGGELRAAGWQTEIADLHAEGFDPVLGIEDEPDWDDTAKRYSDAVLAEMARVERNDATVLFFPVWWWSVPALLKGWIDRVWNQGWAYGGGTYPHRLAWAVGIAGAGIATYEKYGYAAAMKVQIATGIFAYCGVETYRLAMLYGATEGAAETLLGEARLHGRSFAAGG